MTASSDVTSWRDRATVSVEHYAAIVGVSRATAYAAVRAGEVATTLGPENANAINLSSNALEGLFDKTKAKLNEAGLAGVPSLYLEWQSQ